MLGDIIGEMLRIFFLRCKILAILSEPSDLLVRVHSLFVAIASIVYLLTLDVRINAQMWSPNFEDIWILLNIIIRQPRHEAPRVAFIQMKRMTIVSKELRVCCFRYGAYASYIKYTLQQK